MLLTGHILLSVENKIWDIIWFHEHSHFKIMWQSPLLKCERGLKDEFWLAVYPSLLPVLHYLFRSNHSQAQRKKNYQKNSYKTLKDKCSLVVECAAADTLFSRIEVLRSQNLYSAFCSNICGHDDCACGVLCGVFLSAIHEGSSAHIYNPKAFSPNFLPLYQNDVLCGDASAWLSCDHLLLHIYAHQ